MLSSDGAAFTVKNPCGNSGTSKPAAGPAVPLFPRTIDFRGHNSEKCGTRPGIIGQSPAGTDEVVYSNVMETQSGRGWGLGRGEKILTRPLSFCNRYIILLVETFYG
jgi:hypothetical protein